MSMEKVLRVVRILKRGCVTDKPLLRSRVAAIKGLTLSGEGGCFVPGDCGLLTTIAFKMRHGSKFKEFKH